MLHYHITCQCGWMNYPDIVTGLESLSFKEFNRLGQFIYDCAEIHYKPQRNKPLRVLSWTPYKLIFNEGTVVERHICNKDCIEKLDGVGAGPFYKEYWVTDLRDIIYEL